MRSFRQWLRRARVRCKRVLGIEPLIRETVWPRLEFHGDEDCGWYIVAGSLDVNSVVVDVGLGTNVSFSESIIAQYGCLVNGFDPTPRSIQFVKDLANERFKLFEYGLAAAAGRAQFFLPNNDSHVSGSVTHEQHLSSDGIEVELVTIGGIFAFLECDRINLLKLDIEGTEYDVIGSAEFRERARAIDQLCVEFHHRWGGRGTQSTERAVRTLHELGFECAWYSRSTNEEFLFVHTPLR